MTYTPVIFPFVAKQREELQLQLEAKVMLIFNVFKGQTTDAVLNCIEDNNFISVFVPANLTHHFQPLDLTVNGPAKKFLKSVVCRAGPSRASAGPGVFHCIEPQLANNFLIE